MAQEISQKINLFKGLRNDEDSKQIGNDYFADMKNFNYPNAGVLGIESSLYPQRLCTAPTGTNIKGIYEFRYLNANNILKTEYIIATNTDVRRWHILLPDNTYVDTIYGTSSDIIVSSMSDSFYSFVTYNDKLFFTNGKDILKVYYPLAVGQGYEGICSDMGAPLALQIATAAGNPNGTYYYAQTFVTSGGEEVLGGVSNSVTVISHQISLSLPLGYDGTLTRKIYRTKASGSTYYLLASISDNTTTTYTDNIADGALPATTIPTTNNALPKPYQLTLCNQKLFAAVVDAYPTQVFATGVNNEVIDAANYIDVANFGNDNTAVAGIGNDFNKVIVGTGKNILLIDASDYTANTVTVTRAGVGIKNGYTVKYIPAFNDFPGGLMFVSTLNDIRVMSGLQSLPVATSLDNVSTDNWSQAVRGSLENVIKTASNLYAEYFNYQYILLVDGKKYIYDIRTNGWSYQNITSLTYTSSPQVLGVVNIGLNYNARFPVLLSGSSIAAFVEREYTDYKSFAYNASITTATEIGGYIQSGHINVDTKFAFVSKIKLWFLPILKNLSGYLGDSVVTLDATAGALGIGNYKYIVTSIDSSGNEVLCSYSNIIANAGYKLYLSFPSPYVDTVNRKIYRTKANGTTYYYVTTSGNTANYYVDNIADASLSVVLGNTLSNFSILPSTSLNIVIILDDNTQYTIDEDFDIDDLTSMDYKVVNINRPCRWFTYKLTKKSGFVSFQGLEICGQPLKNKE